MLQRALARAAAATMICAVGAAMIQLAIMILGLSRPVAITVISLGALAGLNSLRRRVRAASVRHRFALRDPHGIHR